jgi:hypothetical protein
MVGYIQCKNGSCYLCVKYVEMKTNDNESLCNTLPSFFLAFWISTNTFDTHILISIWHTH